MTCWEIGAILCIVGIVAGNWQRANEGDPECQGCKYNSFGGCENKFLCESGEMWEE